MMIIHIALAEGYLRPSEANLQGHLPARRRHIHKDRPVLQPSGIQIRKRVQAPWLALLGQGA